MIRKYIILLIACCLVLQVQAAEKEIWKDLAVWKLDDGEDIPNKVEELITDTHPNQYGSIEDALIKILSSKKTGLDAKQFACRMLQHVATDKCVSVLAPLLTDKDLSHYARLSLQMMKKSTKAGDALISALEKAPDKVKPGIMGGIAQRRDERAVAGISKLLSHKKSDIVRSAINALGKIGGNSSAGYLQKAKVEKSMKDVLVIALLECAESLKSSDAVGIYKKIYFEKKSRDIHRAVALKGMMRTDESKTLPVVIDFLKEKDSYLRQAALGCLAMVKSKKLSRAAANILKDLNAEKKVEIISLLSDRGDKDVLKNIIGYLKSEDKKVRDAAFMAVSKLGDVKHVKMILKQIKEGRAKKSAMKSLVMMAAPGIDDALIMELKKKDFKIEAVKVLAERKCEKAGPVMINQIEKPQDPEIRKELWKGLAEVASINDIDTMMSMMLEVKDEEEKKRAAKAIKKSCSRHSDKNKIFSVVSKYYEKADETTRILILETASITGGSKALEFTKEVLRSSSKVLHGKAVRALAAWRDVEAASYLLNLAQNNKDETISILALRGYIRMIGYEPVDKEKLKMYRAAISMSKRDDEKRAIISGLKNLNNKKVFELLEKYMNDPNVRIEAEAAILDMPKKMIKKNFNTIKPLLLKIIKASRNKQNREKAQSIIDNLTKKKKKK